MALFNSVLIGKAKGKVGNIVLTSIKGQNIVKSLNDKPANPRSVGQTDNRVQMSNAVLAWQFLNMFFAYAGSISKSTESTYNAFVRLVKSGLSTVLYVNRVLAAKAALALNVFTGNWFQVLEVSTDGSIPAVVFAANGISWLSSYRVCYVEFANDGSGLLIIEFPLLEADFNAGVVVVAGSTLGADNKHAYIYDTASNKITNIK